MKIEIFRHSRNLCVVVFATLLVTFLSACSGDTAELTKAIESPTAPAEVVSEENKEPEKAETEESTEVSVPIISSNIKYIIVDRAAVYEAGSEELLSDSAIIDYLDKGMEIEVIQKVSDLYTKVYYSDGVGYVLNSDFGEYADLVIVYENDTSIDSEPETEYIETENNKETEPDEGDSPIEAWAQEVDDICLDDYLGTYRYFRDNTLPSVTISIKPLNAESVSVFYSYIDPFKGEESIEGKAVRGCFLNHTLTMRFTESLGDREYEAGLTISFDDGSFTYAIIQDTHPGVGTFPTHSVTGVLEKQ